MDTIENIISLTDFENLLIKASTISELEERFKKYLHSWKITGYTFSYFGPIKNKQNGLLYGFASSNLKDWHRYYHEENFTATDQTSIQINKSLIPIFWNIQQQLNESKTKKERKMRKESLALGVLKGLSIPIQDELGYFGQLTLREFKNENCLENWKINKYQWHIATLYFFHYLKPYLLLQTPTENRFGLTNREKQCLILLQKNFSLEAIAETLKITPRTVNFHIQNINHKMLTKNKYQSVEKSKELL